MAPIIKAYSEGKEIQRKNIDGEWKPIDELLTGSMDDLCIKPEPKTRPMTRGEVLYMVTTTPAMVCRYEKGYSFPAHCDSYTSPVEKYEYAIIDKSGEPVDG